jgi:hypothetical protein
MVPAVRLLDPAEAALARLQDRVTTLEVALLRCINLCNRATYTLTGAMIPVPPATGPPGFVPLATGPPPFSQLPPPAPPAHPASSAAHGGPQVAPDDDEEYDQCHTPGCTNQRPVSHGGYCRECRRAWMKAKEDAKKNKG